MARGGRRSASSSKVAAALPFLLRKGWRDGVQGGSRPWLYIGGAALVLRAVRWLSDRDAGASVTEVLGPGQALLVTDGAPPRLLRAAELAALDVGREVQ